MKQLVLGALIIWGHVSFLHFLTPWLAPRPGRNDSFWKLVFDPREYTNPGPMMEHDRATAQHHILKMLRYSNLHRKLPKLSHDKTSGYDSARSPAQEPGELPLP